MTTGDLIKKCVPCYKQRWCMLLVGQRGYCSGPFTDVADNLARIRTIPVKTKARNLYKGA
jgi:hypothetical protein